jgi:hypothetical protein
VGRSGVVANDETTQEIGGGKSDIGVASIAMGLNSLTRCPQRHMIGRIVQLSIWESYSNKEAAVSMSFVHYFLASASFITDSLVVVLQP